MDAILVLKGHIVGITIGAGMSYSVIKTCLDSETQAKGSGSKGWRVGGCGLD